MPHKRLYRSRENRIVAGVFGGLGEYFDRDPTLLRLLGVIFLILTGLFPGALIYLVAVLMVPLEPPHGPQV